MAKSVASRVARAVEAWRAGSRMAVRGLREMKVRVRAVTSASSPKTSSGEAEGEGVRDSGSGVSGGGGDQGRRCGEHGGDSGMYS